MRLILPEIYDLMAIRLEKAVITFSTAPHFEKSTADETAIPKPKLC